MAYAEYGDLNGKPVLFFHGAPGSRLFHHPDDSVAAAVGARIIAIDRPGFGRSDFKPARKLLEWPDDVLELADALNLTKFAVLGYSGGGPYAAACAARIPDRLTAVGLVSSIAPMEDPEMTKGMHGLGHVFLNLDRHLSPLAKLGTGLVCNLWRDNPESYFKSQLDGLNDSEAARALVPGIKAMLTADFREAIRSGTQGITLDLKLLSQPWGFQPSALKPEVLLWHGESDTEAPVAMGKRLARAIPRCRAAFFPQEGHWAIYVHWREILTALLPGAVAPAKAQTLADLGHAPPSISTLSDPSADSGQGLPPASQVSDEVPPDSRAAEAPFRTEGADGKRLTIVQVIESLAAAPPEVAADAPPQAPVAEAPAPGDKGSAASDSADAAPPTNSETPAVAQDAAGSPAEGPVAPVAPEDLAARVAQIAAPPDGPARTEVAAVKEVPAHPAGKKAARRSKVAPETPASPPSRTKPAAASTEAVGERSKAKKGKASVAASADVDKKKARAGSDKVKAAGNHSAPTTSRDPRGRASGKTVEVKEKVPATAKKPARQANGRADRGAPKEVPSAPEAEEPAPKKTASGRRSSREPVHV